MEEEPVKKKKKYPNRWKDKWLDEVVCESRVGDAVGKLNEEQALCVPCDKKINYTSRGFINIADHMKRPAHKQRVAALKDNATLEGGSVEELLQQSCPPAPSSQSGHAPPATPDAAAGSDASKKVQDPPPKKLVKLKDRISSLEATTLAFAAESNFSMSTVPKMIEYAKAMARDPKALQEMKMGRLCASYKMRFGLEKTIQEELLAELRESVFSLNIDEATSKTDHKILTVLVCHFSASHGKLMIHHLVSISLKKVTAESLYKSLTDVFDKFDLPWSNLLSVMMDSCAVMRGSKGGLETLIRQRKAPHLLDIDGDTCHHAHNAAKSFCSTFDGSVDRLLMDLHTDFKWSSEHIDLLQDLCLILGMKVASPVRSVPHRWLSILDSTQRALQLLPALTLFYYSFLDSKDRELYKDYVSDIMAPLNEKQRSSVQKTQAVLTKKFQTFTPDGKQRKKRILEALFISRPSTLLTMNFFTAVLPSLKKYVTLFQTTSPMVHHLLTEQQTLLEDFLSLFVKPEAVKNACEQCKRKLNKVPVIEQTSYLRKLDLAEKENLVPLQQMFLGQEARNLLEKKVGKVRFVSDDNRKAFLQKARQSYIACGKVLHQKMPLDNKALKICSALEPQRRCATETREVLSQLPEFVPQLTESDSFLQEVRSYSVSQTLPSAADCRIDQWWQNLKNRYPHLCQGACAMLSCFHGPIVESSFSAMANIMDCHSSRLSPEVFSAVQSVRHYIQARDSTALKLFAKKEPRSDPVDKQLAKNMQAAYKLNRQNQNIGRAQKAQKKSELGVEENPEQSHASQQKSKGCQDEKGKDTPQPGTAIPERQTFFANLARKLEEAGKRSFYDLKNLARKTSSHLDKFPIQCMSPQAKHYSMDPNALKLLPGDISDLLPVDVVGDGNCLPRCGSLFAFEHQRNHVEIRARITIELALNEEYYICGSTEEGLKKLPEAELRRIFQEEVCSVPKLGKYMGIWAVHALSSVLEKRLQSIYPQVGNDSRSDYHRELNPRQPSQHEQSLDSYIPAVMWTRMGPSSSDRWLPNHFVACLPGTLSTDSGQTTKPQPASESAPTSASRKRKHPNADIRSFFTKD